MSYLDQFRQGLVCPKCGRESLKVIYAGIPARLCTDEACSCLWGFWSFLITWLPFNGFFFVYEGSYLKGLWAWLRQKRDDGDDDGFCPGF